MRSFVLKPGPFKGQGPPAEEESPLHKAQLLAVHQKKLQEQMKGNANPQSEEQVEIDSGGGIPAASINLLYDVAYGSETRHKGVSKPPQEEVEKAVKACIEGAGGPGMHVLNLGHGVLQPTPEGNVQAFVDAARKWGAK